MNCVYVGVYSVRTFKIIAALTQTLQLGVSAIVSSISSVLKKESVRHPAFPTTPVCQYCPGPNELRFEVRKGFVAFSLV